MDVLTWSDWDDIGYEFRREALLAMGIAPGPARLYLVPPPPARTPPVRCGACRSKVARCFCPLAVAAAPRAVAA